MSRLSFNADLPVSTLIDLGLTSEYQEVFQREFVYGSQRALELGLQPVDDVPDILVDFDDFEAVIKECHEKKIFPMYWQQRTWAPDGYRWNQNGLNYCWSWSGVAALLDMLAAEGRPTPQLAPVTAGGAVGWANKGNYLDSFVEWVRNDGIAPAEFVPNMFERNYRQYKEGWKEAAKGFRLRNILDTNRRAGTREMMRQVLSILKLGRPQYAAWNRLSHAMEIIGMLWTPGKWMNITLVIRNSHDETEPIEMYGENATPDEAIGFMSSEPT